MPHPSGGTNLSHAKQHAKNMGWDTVPEIDEMGSIPNGFEYFIDWFRELSEGRTYHMSGPNPLSFTDIMNWKALFGIHLFDWQVRVLKEIDNVFLSVLAASGTKPKPEKQEIDPKRNQSFNRKAR